MTKILTSNKNYYDIANTIRQMKNVNTTYKPIQMASALKDIYSNEVDGVPPLTFESNGMDLLDYRIDGASGGVGDRTSNLIDYSTVTRGYRIMWASGTIIADNSAIMSDFIAVSNGIYRASVSLNLIGYDINKNYIGTYDPYSKIFKKDYSSKTTYYDIANNNVKFVKLLSYSATDTISQDTMFCNSTTIPEYEPYGYKVPVVISGKNLLQNTASSQTINDVTFTVNNDGSIICNGTSSAVTTFAISIKLNSNINYVLSGSPKNGSAETYRLDLRNTSYSVYNNTVDNGNGINFTVEENGTYLVCIRIAANYTCNNLTFYPMIRLATIEDDTYEPYIEPTTTNIYLDEPILENESISLSDAEVDIPTIEGTNTLTIDTTVQPSNVYIQAPKDTQEMIESKSLLQPPLNKFGANISTLNPIIDYSNVINDIYNKLPKITQSGAGFTIENVQNGLVDDFKMNGTDLEQDTTIGKNLCGIPNQTFNHNGVDVTIQDGEITLNGTCNSSTVKNIEPVVPIILNGDYTLNIIYIEGTLSGNSNFNIRKADNQEYINGIPLETQNKFKLFNFTSDTSVIYGLYAPNGTVFSNFKMKIQLISGTEADYNFEPYTGGIPSPNPDYPQDIKVVENRQVITNSGKNLLNPYTEPSERYGITASYNQNTHVYTFNGTCTRDNVTFILSNNKINFTTQVTKSITFWVGGSCTNSCDIRHFDSNYNSSVIYSIVNISSTNNKISKTSNYTFESPINYATIRFNNGSVANNLQIKVMVTDDDNTDYEPYYNPVSYNIDLNLENIYLAKMPDTNYKNRIYKNNGNWYFEENVEKVILDGSEEWGYGSISGVFYTTSITNYAISNNVPYSNYYTGVSNVSGASNMGQQSNNTIGFINVSGQTTPRFYIKDTKYTNNTPDLKTWLSTHNLEVWYILATPVTTQITNTTLINQLEALYLHTGTNIITISNSNNMIPEIEITRLKELEKLV